MSKENSFTIVGEFFPEVYPAFRSGKWTRGEEDPLATEMRLFSACSRWSYKRIVKGGLPQEQREHKENGTVPPVIFGGRKLFRNVCKGKVTRDEWRAARKNRLYARGDRTKGGNPNMKITFDGHAFRMTVTISHLSELTGVDALDRPIMSRAPRVLGRLWIPAKYQARLLAALHQLESKLHGHNGLARPQQESFFSCWRELKTLALAFR